MSPSITIKWCKSYLDERIQKYAVNGFLSSADKISCGVSQESILAWATVVSNLHI